MSMQNPNGVDLYKALSFNRPFVLGVQYQVAAYCGGPGICDPVLNTSVSALEPFRYDTALFQWASAPTVVSGVGTTAANTDGNDLDCPSNQTRTYFNTGIGQPIDGGWWTKTVSDTDLFNQGAPVDLGYMFLAMGMTFHAGDPFQRGGTNVDADDPKLYSAWLQESANGAGYSFLIQKFHINYSNIQFNFGDTGQTYRLGVGGFWPTWGDPAGQQTVRNGLTSMPGAYLPFTAAMCIGAQNTIRQLRMFVATGQHGRVQNNAGAGGTISGSVPGVGGTAGTINTANVGTVYAPVRLLLVGMIVCVPYQDSCGAPSLTPDEVLLLRAQLGMQPAGPGAVAPGTPVAPVMGGTALTTGFGR